MAKSSKSAPTCGSGNRLELIRCPDCGKSITGDYRFVLHSAFKHDGWDLLERWYEAKGKPNPFVRSQQDLYSKNEKLRRELWRHKRKPTGLVGYGLLFVGCMTLISSIASTSNISLFIGLALVFWGAILLFARPESFVKGSLLRSTAISFCLATDEMISELKLEGKGIYLPPRSLKDLKSGRIFIPRQKNIRNPSSGVLGSEKIFLNPEGISIVPPGLGLVNLYEEELGIAFAKKDLDYLLHNLPKVLVNGLEIAKYFRIDLEDNKVTVEMKNSIYDDFCKMTRKWPRICGQIGCPLCSSIACALARTTGRPIIIEKNNLNMDENKIEVQYRIV